MSILPQTKKWNCNNVMKKKRREFTATQKEYPVNYLILFTLKYSS